MKPVIIIAIAVVFGIGIGLSLNVSAEEGLIPSWIKNTASFWVEGNIGDSEFLSALQFLIDNGILTVMKTPASDTEINSDNDKIMSQIIVQNPRENLRHQKNTFLVAVDDQSANEECRQLKNCFNPRLVKIKETDTIEFINNGEIQHRLSSSDRYNEPDSQQFYNQILEHGESFEYPYNVIGTYYVTCLNHPFMKLIVQVQSTY